MLVFFWADYVKYARKHQERVGKPESSSWESPHHGAQVGSPHHGARSSPYARVPDEVRGVRIGGVRIVHRHNGAQHQYL